MSKQVRGLLNTNLVKITPIPAITDTSDDLQTLIDQTAVMYIRQQKKSTGATIDKQNARNKLTQFALQIAGAIEAYAIEIDNNLMRNDYHFPKTGLNRYPDTEFLTKTQDIHTEATALLIPLTPYGVTAPILTDFQAAIDLYTGLLEKPRQIITYKESATLTIEEIIEQMRTALEKLDVLMRYFIIIDVLFFKDYTNARKIINHGHHFTRIGLFIELEDGVDAMGITANLTNNKNSKTYTATTNQDGLAQIPSMLPGTYTLEIAHAGYKTYINRSLKILKGKNNQFNIGLDPE